LITEEKTSIELVGTWKQLKMMECLVTMGWSNSVAATNLAYKMDFISYHVIEHLEYETNINKNNKNLL
jgi:hypothetical protein